MSKRDAAALLLTRGEGAAVEVYLVERSPELRFFGGYLALPGGTLAPVDGDAVADEGAAMQCFKNCRRVLRSPLSCLSCSMTFIAGWSWFTW